MSEDFLQDLGEIKGKLDFFISQSAERRDLVNQRLDELLEETKKQSKRIDLIVKELDKYKTIARTFKVIGLILLSVITFKISDAFNLWNSLMEIVHGN